MTTIVNVTIPVTDDDDRTIFYVTGLGPAQKPAEVKMWIDPNNPDHLESVRAKLKAVFREIFW